MLVITKLNVVDLVKSVNNQLDSETFLSFLVNFFGCAGVLRIE